MRDASIIKNKWEEKAYRDPRKHRVTPKQKAPVDDSTPLLKKADAHDLVIKWNCEHRIKTLRGIRKA